jgi:hypothetical protein
VNKDGRRFLGFRVSSKAGGLVLEFMNEKNDADMATIVYDLRIGKDTKV